MDNTTNKIPEGKQIVITIDPDYTFHVAIDTNITGVDVLKASTVLIECIINREEQVKVEETEE